MHPEVIQAELVDKEPPPAEEQKSILEQLLSREALQYMMQLGGGMLVLGFVVWLWSIGLFENPVVVAVLMGTITLSVLAVGVALVRFSRYQLAGTGMTLLASLAMPLNLWFYDAQGLITIANGGHLWVPAAMCCVIYAFVARALPRPTFVYAFVGGIVMTGMLFLADQAIGRFWELMPPATFLVIFGWICIHVERLFADEDGDFSRKNFGQAFRLSGLFVLANGLGLVLAGQLFALFHRGGPAYLRAFDLPAIATDPFQKTWALALILASSAGFASEFLIRRENYRHLIAAFATAAWGVLALLDLCSIPIQLPLLAGILALVVIADNLFSSRLPESQGVDSEAVGLKKIAKLGGEFYAYWLSLGLIGLALVQFVSQYTGWADRLIFAETGWGVVLQLALTAFACWTTGTRLADSRVLAIRSDETAFQLAGCAVATFSAMTLATVLAPILGFDVSVNWVAAIGLLIPASLIAVIHMGRRSANSSGEASSSVDSVRKPEPTELYTLATDVSIATLMVSLLGMAGPVFAGPSYLNAAWILAAMAMLFFQSAYGWMRDFNRLAGGLAAAGAASMVLAWAGMGLDYAMVLGITLLGAGLAVFVAWSRHTGTRTEASLELELPANLMVLLGSVACVLLAGSRVIDGQSDLQLLCVLGIQLTGIATAGLLSRSRAWRQTFRAAAVATSLAGIFTINQLIVASFFQKAELACVLFGFVLLSIGHVAWAREGDEEDVSATFGLWFGSLLASVPLGIGLLCYRTLETTTVGNWMLFHEVSVLVVGFVLLMSGIACRIRASTLTGGGLLAVFVGSLVALIQLPSILQNVSVVMMIAGGAFFTIAILLSAYRDRLISLPEDVRNGRGMFRVMKWR